MNITCFFVLLLIPSLMLHIGRIIEVREYGCFNFTLMTQGEKDSFSGAYGLIILALSTYAGFLTSSVVYMKMFEDNLSLIMAAGVFITCVGVWAITTILLGLFFFILKITPILSEAEDSNDETSQKILTYSLIVVTVALTVSGYYIFKQMGLITLLTYTGVGILIGVPMYVLRYRTAALKKALEKARDDIGELASFLADDEQSKGLVIRYCLQNETEDILNLCWNAGVEFEDNHSLQAVKFHIEKEDIEITKWITGCPDALKLISLKIMVN